MRFATPVGLLKEGGAQSVKLEGGRHVAKTMQSHRAGRHTRNGAHRTYSAGRQPTRRLPHTGQEPRRQRSSLLKTLRRVEEGGAYSIVLEGVPSQLAQIVTERLSIPTIGIGAGVHCDGQVQVFHDMMGLYTDFTPKHARKYAQPCRRS